MEAAGRAVKVNTEFRPVRIDNGVVTRPASDARHTVHSYLAHLLWGAEPVAGDDVVFCHGDPGPWNFVWRDQEAVGLIDLDYLHPAPRLDDVANALPWFGPLCRASSCSTGTTSRWFPTASGGCEPSSTRTATFPVLMWPTQSWPRCRPRRIGCAVWPSGSGTATHLGSRWRPRSRRGRDRLVRDHPQTFSYDGGKASLAPPRAWVGPVGLEPTTRGNLSGARIQPPEDRFERGLAPLAAGDCRVLPCIRPRIRPRQR